MTGRAAQDPKLSLMETIAWGIAAGDLRRLLNGA
jgi:hypothetical protein